ncbi:MAG: hypothetical protein B7Y59_02375 [Burkholderiales bacterium 35-55-47]|uniref:hypothetical protein n=1 Tax=Limnohabitans sp. TaxID=1907725 RepID=UPI000BC9C3E2|nr:hypothetical protein [Limnohabitans sp.]OYY19963.1 MAG: hypothetical protein B7Y59_02375 [Burkholderiales bacterium 35-55-47]OYZ74426.1 MAG: hypothetical protein B7Y06_02635 [Burkholderiales bacterium 24-55-52]OZB01683.1 MAG: hypothetical protein B7X62_02370 [Burkholderiales bacterium 39-55-53]HQR86183.1 hypothetical protein [Limnohabitans sp.]HQS25900.1 hypothetical protein [Limnohabitans sp.]
MFANFKIFLFRLWAKWKSTSTHPEEIELDLFAITSKRHAIRVAIIDDQPFPYTPALEAEGCIVKIFDDYSTKVSQRNQKSKIIQLKNYDVIICDINDIGTEIYPGSEGISVLEDLRNKHPLKVIVAYTADPGKILVKLKKQNTIDKTFAKEWQVDDFIINFRPILDIFTKPKNRWDFIQCRLNHLGLAQQKINAIQKVFVENILFCQMISSLPSFNEAHLQDVISNSASRIDPKSTLMVGLNSIEIAQIFFPS